MLLRVIRRTTLFFVFITSAQVFREETYLRQQQEGRYNPQSDALKVFFGAFGTFGK